MAPTRSTLIARYLAPITFALFVLADLFIVAFIIGFSFPNVFSIKILFAVLIAFPCIMTIISFYQFFRGDAGTIKNELKTGKYNKLLPKLEQKYPICSECHQVNPPRTFHCSKCGECHLKMDRHINIFGKCVALKNQRPFIVMLKWAAVTNFVSAIIVLMITFSSQTELNFGITVSIIYASVGLLFEIFWDNEMSFVRSNQTHIGKTKKIPTRVYDLGLSKNIQQVFDDGFFSYYIPSRSERTGFEWIYEKNDD